MAEGSERVRTVQQHLRRGAALLKTGDCVAAVAEIDAALALDPQSLPAQALRDRITRTVASAPAPAVSIAPEASSSEPKRFVPNGVNAESWMGFEQRVQARRFRALLDTMNASIAAGDIVAARVALDEARELRPDEPELDDFAARIAATPAIPPLAAASSRSRVWPRALGAVALLLIGVSLFTGLEWLRPSERLAPAPASAPAEPVSIPAQDLRIADTPEEAVMLPIEQPVEQPVASIDRREIAEYPRPRGTTGTAPPQRSAPQVMPAVEHRAAAEMDQRRLIEIAPQVPRRPLGEIPDDYVVSPVRAAAAATEVTPSPLASARMPDAPIVGASSTSAAPVGAPMPAVGRLDENKVQDVLRRYAQAYGQLNASAAREVWPTVDEKALARAFQGLESQAVSFNDCEIQIRGTVANASCRGQASYVGKVGSREPRTEPRTWRFDLRRDGDAWTIENAETRRQPVTSYKQ
jgi:hypothetical protein